MPFGVEITGSGFVVTLAAVVHQYLLELFFKPRHGPACVQIFLLSAQGDSGDAKPIEALFCALAAGTLIVRPLMQAIQVLFCIAP